MKVTNAIKSSFSFSSQTMADGTHVHWDSSAENHLKSTWSRYEHPVAGHSVYTHIYIHI